MWENAPSGLYCVEVKLGPGFADDDNQNNSATEALAVDPMPESINVIITNPVDSDIIMASDTVPVTIEITDNNGNVLIPPLADSLTLEFTGEDERVVNIHPFTDWYDSQYIDWYFNIQTALNLLGNGEMVSPYTGDQFYDYCTSSIPYQDEAKEGEVVKRIAGEFQFIVSAAAEELSTFISVYEPSNSIVQERPEYTNVENGIGIFSSRNIEVRTKLLHSESLEHLDDLNIKFYFTDK